MATMELDIENPRDIIHFSIQKMQENRGKYRRSFSRDADIFLNLDTVRKNNTQGRPLCGPASSWLADFLPGFLKEHGLKCSVFIVTSSIQNGCFHNFNMVAIEGREPVICDLTASQYFNRPMTALKGHAYFAGTRDELRNIVATARENTWNVLRRAFPTLELRSLWDVDFHYYRDRDFRRALCSFLDNESQESCLRTESLYYPMEITWGAKRSHLLNRHMDPHVRAALTEAFGRAGIADLTEEKDPAIPDLITFLSSQNFSLQDAPKPHPEAFI